MANFIRPDPAPLPPATTSAALVVTMAGGTPLDVVPQPPVTISTASLPVATTTVVVTAAVTLVTTTSTMVVTTVVPPVTSTVVSTVASDSMRVSDVEPSIVPTSIMPQIGVIISSQQSLAPVIEATGIPPAVTAGRVSVTPQTSSGAAILPALPSLSGMFCSASQGRSVVNTSITPSGSNHPVSHPIIIQPSRLRPPASVMMGVEGLTLPSDPKATITATVARLVDPVSSQTSLPRFT